MAHLRTIHPKLSNLQLNQKNEIVIDSIMEKDDMKYLGPNESWKSVGRYMSKYNLINVPIVDESMKLLGIVSVDDILPWLLKER